MSKHQSREHRETQRQQLIEEIQAAGFQKSVELREQRPLDYLSLKKLKQNHAYFIGKEKKVEAKRPEKQEKPLGRRRAQEVKKLVKSIEIFGATPSLFDEVQKDNGKTFRKPKINDSKVLRAALTEALAPYLTKVKRWCLGESCDDESMKGWSLESLSTAELIHLATQILDKPEEAEVPVPVVEEVNDEEEDAEFDARRLFILDDVA